jgi:hypothetical protein
MTRLLRRSSEALAVPLALLSYLLMGSGTASAAEIAWSPAFEIETDADIDLSGEIVRAVNVAGLATGVIEVTFPNGQAVEFEPEHTFEMNDSIGGLGTGNVTTGGNYYSAQDEGLTTGNSELDTVFNDHGWVGGAPGSAVAVLQLSDLEVGKTYQIQLVGAADDRSCCEYRQMIIVDEDFEPVQQDHWFGRSNDFDQDDARGPGSTIGVFTADGDSQDIFIMGTNEFDDGNGGSGDGNDPGLSAYILSLVTGGGLAGDVNGDGVLDAADIDAEAAAIRAGSTDTKYDLDANGSVTGADHTYLVHTHLKTWIGDANLDREFNSADFVAVFGIGEYEDATNGNSIWAEGDWNGDGDFNSSDFVAAFQDGGYELGPRPAVAVVPEPTTLLLLLVGGMPLILRRHG